MPPTPRICAEPGCPNRADSGTRCTDHTRQQRRTLDAGRPSARARGYDARHERWRAAILTRDPVCMHCHAAPSTQADHIVPISAGGSRWELDNGQGLCASCHSRKTAREGRWT